MEHFENFAEKEYVFKNEDALREFIHHLEVSKIPFTIFGNTVVNVPPTTDLVHGKYTVDGTYKYLVDKYNPWLRFKRKIKRTLNNIPNIFKPKILILFVVFFVVFIGSRVSQMGPVEKLRFFTGDASQLLVEREKDEKTNFVGTIFNRGEDSGKNSTPIRFSIGEVNITIGPTPTPTPEPKGIVNKIRAFINEE